MPLLARMERAEFVSKDPLATQKFLESTFGLKFSVIPGTGYAIYGHEEGAPASGVGIRRPLGFESPGTIAYFTVPDIGLAISNVEAAGGRVVIPRTEVPGLGWTAVYVGPGDVAQGLFQSSGAPSHGAPA